MDQDRPALQKDLRALLLTTVAGGAIGVSRQRWYHWNTAALTTWNLLRRPVSLGLTVVTVSLLVRYAPRRRQPGWSWLMVGPAWPRSCGGWSACSWRPTQPEAATSAPPMVP